MSSRRCGIEGAGEAEATQGEGSRAQTEGPRAPSSSPTFRGPVFVIICSFRRDIKEPGAVQLHRMGHSKAEPDGTSPTSRPHPLGRREGPSGSPAFLSTGEHLHLGSARTSHLDNQKVGTRGGKILMRSNQDISTKETKRERGEGSKWAHNSPPPLVSFPSTDSDIFYVCRYHRARSFMPRSNSLRS